MGKTHISKDLQKRRTSRSLLAVSLAASLAAFGCTTNLNPGNGAPARSGPEIRTTPTSGISTGSETATPPPMTSSYTRAEVMPRVTPRLIRRSPAEAAAIMAGRQALRGRYLGQANPGPGNRPYASDYAGGFVPPALLTNPQLTINSSISSPSTSAINSGAGGVGVGTDTGVLVTAGVTTGTTAAATLAGTTTGAVAGTTGTGVGLPAGAFAAVRPTVTESIANNPAVTAASVGVGRTGVPVTGTTTAATTATTTTTTGATAATTATAAGTTTAASTAGAVRIIRGTTGGVTITNSNNQ
jgi:hypothetical protein